MEMATKIGEAASGLWLAFSTRERIVLCYGAFLCFTLLAGISAERKRRREQAELISRIDLIVREVLRDVR